MAKKTVHGVNTLGYVEKVDAMPERARLFEGCPVNIYTMPKESVFYPTDYQGVREPVIFIEGPYEDFFSLKNLYRSVVNGVPISRTFIRLAYVLCFPFGFGLFCLVPSG